MKTIGLLGGMSWKSSIEYERLINEAVSARLGGTSSASLVIRSFNFAEIEKLQLAGLWDEAASVLAEAAVNLERSGAEAILICANTMHLMADHIQAQISVPLLHIADAAGEAIQSQNLQKVLLLGTKYTMEKDFYRARLQEKFGLEILTPAAPERDEVHRIIYDELVRGVLNSTSRKFFSNLIQEFAENGCEAVIAGCTEIELLVKPEDSCLPLFATTQLHVTAAVDFALS